MGTATAGGKAFFGVHVLDLYDTGAQERTDRTHRVEGRLPGLFHYLLQSPLAIDGSEDLAVFLQFDALLFERIPLLAQPLQLELQVLRVVPDGVAVGGGGHAS